MLIYNFVFYITFKCYLIKSGQSHSGYPDAKFNVLSYFDNLAIYTNTLSPPNF
jgi:hypothetical protein